MKHAQPQGLSRSRQRVEQLISKTTSNGSAGNRIEVLSREFLGLPYKTNPLIGSAGTPEIFTVSLDSFDCVTYMETVLAMSLARSVDDFTEWLRKIRYEGGRVDWHRRNHYMTAWIRNNRKLGAVRPLAANVKHVEKQRVLDMVPGLPPRETQFQCVPKPSIRKLKPAFQTGDLVFFASTRKHLDVFHCGIIVRDGERLLLRHASRSQKGVVEQDFEQFLKNNRMAGIIVARPRPASKSR